MTLLAILFLILAVGSYSISQLVLHGKFKFAQGGYYGFWDERSYERKYKKNDDIDPLGWSKYPAPTTYYYKLFNIPYKERFPGSATFLVLLTDGYHLTQSLSFLCLSGSLSMFSGYSFFIFWIGIVALHATFYRIFQK